MVFRSTNSPQSFLVHAAGVSGEGGRRWSGEKTGRRSRSVGKTIVIFSLMGKSPKRKRCLRERAPTLAKPAFLLFSDGIFERCVTLLSLEHTLSRPDRSEHCCCGVVFRVLHTTTRVLHFFREDTYLWARQPVNTAVIPAPHCPFARAGQLFIPLFNR